MEQSKTSRTKIAGFVMMALLVLIDQLTKYWAANNLKAASIPVIKGVFELAYVENRGAAFGIMQNANFFFLAVTLIMLAVIVGVLRRIPDVRKYRMFTLSLFVLMAGAVGNILDRMMNGYVVDFLYFSLINFPVFNVADICVVCSVILLIILMLFVYRGEDDLAFLKPEKPQEENKK